MKLLMITRKVDKTDGLAGFTYNWIKKIAGNIDRLYVICLEKGEIAGLPANVEVYSLGKENGKNRWREFWNLQKFAKQLVPQVDGVFAHQNPEYGILISFWTKFYHKKLIAWYVHRQVSWKLRLLNYLADQMISVNRQSFRLVSNKVVFLHHGIDTDIFSFKPKAAHQELRLLTVSRISPTKKIDLMIDLVKALNEKLNTKVVLDIIGSPIMEADKEYLEQLKSKVTNLSLTDQVKFLGSIANDQTVNNYQTADIFLNFSQTGSVDKTVLEAASCGTLVLTSNPAFDFLSDFSKTNSEDLNQLVSKIDYLYHLSNQERNDFGNQLRNIVVQQHNLDDLVKRIIKLFYGQTSR